MPSSDFDRAADYLANASSLSQVSNTVKLELYGLFKYVTVAPEPTSSKPSIFDMTGRAKWDAWSAAAKKYSSTETAERRYMEIAKELGWNESTTISHQDGKAESQSQGSRDDIWDPEDSTDKKGSGGGFGISVSTMAYGKESNEKDLHGLAIDNDVEMMKQLLEIVPDLNVNQYDEHGFTALHLAADRGHLDVVRLLVEHGANRELKDPDDFSAIELARIAGHEEIVTFLS